MTDTLPFTLVQSLLKRKAKQAGKELPDLSISLSTLDYLMRWQVRDKDNNLIAEVNGEKVEWHDSI